eukprot:SAG31_NODE_673_length_12919_cov_143.235725_2_plen_1954_part_00
MWARFGVIIVGFLNAVGAQQEQGLVGCESGGVNNIATFEGAQTRPLTLDDSATLTTSAAIGMAYASVPPVTLRPGDKLAFDTSYRGSTSVSLQLWLGTCKPWHAIDSINSESQLPRICEDMYVPSSSMKPVFTGTVAGTKQRNGTTDHEFEGLWYEFVIELQEEYCHAGGTFIALLTDVSDTSIFHNLTASPADQTLQAVLTRTATDAAVGSEWSSLIREAVPVLRIMPDYALRRNATMFTDHTDVVAGVLGPSGDTALYAQAGSTSEQVVSSTLIRIRTSGDMMEQLDAAAVGEEWFTAAFIDASGEALFLGTASRPAKILRVNPANVTESVEELNFPSSPGEITFIVEDGGYIYVGINSFPAQILRVRISDNQTKTITLGRDEILPKCAGVDSEGGMLIVGLLGTLPGRIIMIQLASFERYCSHSLSEAQEGILTLSVDAVYGNLYVGVNSAPAKIVRIRLPDIYSHKAIHGAAVMLQDLIPDMHMIAWDRGDPWEVLDGTRLLDITAGFIHDGGGDMYDNGNIINTSAVDCEPVEYHDGFIPTSSSCFGGAQYKMHRMEGGMLFVGENGTPDPLEFRVRGNLGADDAGIVVTHEFITGRWTGFVKSVCEAGDAVGSMDAAIHHLVIVDSSDSDPFHTWSNSTDSDEDTVGNIAPGSPILYFMYSDSTGDCLLEDHHRDIFDAAILFLESDIDEDVLVLSAEKTFPTKMVLDPQNDFAYTLVQITKSMNKERTFALQRISLHPFCEAGYLEFEPNEKRPGSLMRDDDGSGNLLLAFNSVEIIDGAEYMSAEWVQGTGAGELGSTAVTKMVGAFCRVDDGITLPVVTLFDDFFHEHTGRYSHSIAMTLSGMNVHGVTVSYRVMNGTATSGIDFALTPLDGIFTWLPGESGVQRRELNIIDDAEDEENEYFFVLVETIENATLGRSPAIYADENLQFAKITILDDDVVPTVPQGVVGIADDTNFVLNLGWEAPVSEGNHPLSAYRIYRQSCTPELLWTCAFDFNDTNTQQFMTLCRNVLLTEQHDDGLNSLSEDFDCSMQLVYEGMRANSSITHSLDGGMMYSYQICAVNEVGESERTPFVTFSTPPGVPTAIRSTGQTGSSVSLSWQAPEVTSGAAVSSYKIYRNDGQNAGELSTVGYVGAATETTVDDLDGGSQYVFAVTALNDQGEGPRVTLQQSTSPLIPQDVRSVHQTTSSILLHWNAPGRTTGSEVTGYKVYRRFQYHFSDVFVSNYDDSVHFDLLLQHFFSGAHDDLIVDTLEYDGSGLPETAAELVALDGGTEYWFLVGALSEAGESGRSGSVVQSTAPPRVSSVRSTLQTTTSIALEWDVPEIPTGAEITGYKVYRNDGLGGESINTISYDGTGSTAAAGTVSNILGGRVYTFVATALSVAGEGDASGATDISTAPPAVTNISSIAQTTTSITLAWDAPQVLSNGSAVSGYKIYRNDGQFSASLATIGYDGTGSLQTAGTVSGLVGGRLYTFVISALSDSGESDMSEALQQSTAPPVASSLRNIHQTATTVTLEWIGPSVTTGVPVDYYRAYWRTVELLYYGTGYDITADDVTWEDFVTTPAYVAEVKYHLECDDFGDSPCCTESCEDSLPAVASSSNCYVLLKRLLYGIRCNGTDVVICPSMCESAYAVCGEYTMPGTYNAINQRFVTSTPFCESLYTGTGTISVQNVTGCFDATLAQLGVDDLTNVEIETVFGGQVTIEDLESGTAVEFAVSALSSAGEGDNTASVYQQTTVDTDANSVFSTTPDAPTGLRSTHQGTTTISLAWIAPTVASGDGLSGYMVYRNDGAGGIVLSTIAYNGNGILQTAATVEGLYGGTQYSFIVEPLSSAGAGTASPVLHQSTAPPSTEITRFISQTSSTVSLQWEAPTVSNGDTIRGYRIFHDSTENTMLTVLGHHGGTEQTTAEIGNLRGGRLYSFTVMPYSNSGEADRSPIAQQSTAPPNTS